MRLTPNRWQTLKMPSMPIRVFRDPQQVAVSLISEIPRRLVKIFSGPCLPWMLCKCVCFFSLTWHAQKAGATGVRAPCWLWGAPSWPAVDCNEVVSLQLCSGSFQWIAPGCCTSLSVFTDSPQWIKSSRLSLLIVIISGIGRDFYFLNHTVLWT